MKYLFGTVIFTLVFILASGPVQASECDVAEGGPCYVLPSEAPDSWADITDASQIGKPVTTMLVEADIRSFVGIDLSSLPVPATNSLDQSIAEPALAADLNKLDFAFKHQGYAETIEKAINGKVSATSK